MFYQNFDSKIKSAEKRRNSFNKTAKILDIAATSVCIVCVSSVMPFGVGLVALPELPALLTASFGIVACGSIWGLSHISSSYAKAVNYEIKYYNEKKITQDLFKESENTPEKRKERRQRIAFLKKEFKKMKLTGNESTEESLQKSRTAKDIAIAISNHCEILRASCTSRHEKAKALLKFRQASRQNG